MITAFMCALQLNSATPDTVSYFFTSTAVQVIISQLPMWTEASKKQHVMLPKLVGVDWRINVKSASEFVTKMSVPTCLVDLQVQEQAMSSTEMPETTTVGFELSKGT